MAHHNITNLLKVRLKTQIKCVSLSLGSVDFYHGDYKYGYCLKIEDKIG